MTISRIKTSTKDTKEAVVLVIDGQKLLIAPGDLVSKFDTTTKIKAELEKQASTSLPDVFVHKNRDGSIAIATGAAPDVWPEDEPAEPKEVK